MVAEYLGYGNYKKRPVDLLLFNFTSTFSTSILTNPYTKLMNGASHSDVLLYLFTYPIFEEEFEREVPEEKAKNLMVSLVSQYMTTGFSYDEVYPRCKPSGVKDRFCDYMLVERSGDNLVFTASDEFDMEAVKVLNKVDVIMGNN